MYLCGTKCDLVSENKAARKVDRHVVEAYREEIGAKDIIETSAKTGHNIGGWLCVCLSGYIPAWWVAVCVPVRLHTCMVGGCVCACVPVRLHTCMVGGCVCACVPVRLHTCMVGGCVCACVPVRLHTCMVGGCVCACVPVRLHTCMVGGCVCVHVCVWGGESAQLCTTYATALPAVLFVLM